MSAGVRWRRVWPGGRAGDPVAGRHLVLEGRDGTGRIVAATRPVGGPVQVVEHDTALPALEALRAEGRLLAHRAGKRAVLRTAGGFVKVATPRATRTALARHAVLLDALAGAAPHRDRPDLVAVTGADVDAGVLRLHPADGTDLTAVLAAGDVVTAHRAGLRTAAASTALARCTAPDLPVHDLAAEAAVLQRWTAEADAFGVLPAGAARAAAVAAEAVLALGPEPSVPAHRDLHDGQVLLGERVTLLDVDTAALADPGLDAANLLAHLDLAVVTGAAAQPVAHAVERGLWEGWREHGHPLVTAPGRVRVLRAATRCRLVAVHAFRGLTPDHARALLGRDPGPGAAVGR